MPRAVVRPIFLTALAAGIALASSLPAQTRGQLPKAVVEFRPQPPAALTSLEVEVTGAGAGTSQHLPVSDAALFVTKSGGDAEAELTAVDGTPDSRPAARFNVRLFIVAGGHLYTGGRGQCGAWENDVSRCSAACEGGISALRRNGAAPLELLIRAIPGGEAGQGTGLTITTCGLDDEDEAKLIAKSGRGLAVTGFGRD